jgi:hypothetical protein
VKHILIFIFLISSAIPAQDFNVGFGLQASLYKKYDLIKSEGITDIVLYPPEIHFSFEYLPIEILSVQLRLGQMFESNRNGVSGFEYGVLVKYFINPSIYAIGIYTNHLNISFSGGGHSTRKAVTFGMPGLGIGYKATNHLYLELTYLDPKDVIIIEDYNYIIGDTSPYNQIQLNWLIRMNI